MLVMKYIFALILSLSLGIACKQVSAEEKPLIENSSHEEVIQVVDTKLEDLEKVVVEDNVETKTTEKREEEKAAVTETPKAKEKTSEIKTTKKVVEKPVSEIKDKPSNNPEPILEKEKVAESRLPKEKKEEVNMKTEEPIVTTEPKMEEPKIEKPKVEVEVEVPTISHDAFNALLSKYVSSAGKVNYKGFQSEEGKLDAYLKLLAENAPASDWSKNKKLAYWINLYNAGTIKLILNNYPISSITKIANGKPWDKVWIKSGDKTLSLNNIENDIIRPTFKEPKIHFAVNCAAKSCPSLLNKAFTESNLNSLLEQQTKKFINNSAFNQISSTSAKVSKIFEWYGVDFGDLKTYLNKYANQKIGDNVSIEFVEYDWALNE